MAENPGNTVNAAGVRPADDAPDANRLWQQVHDRVMAALQGIPRDAAEKLAQGIARGVVSQYQAELKKGTEPGVALQVAQSWEQTWTADAQRQNGIDPKTGRQVNSATPAGQAGPGAAEGGALAPGEVKNAQQQYIDGIKRGNQTYEDILKNPTNLPGARGTYREIEAPNVDPITGAKVGTAAQQLATTVQRADTSDLEATARGQGAGQQSAAARYKSLLLDQGRNVSGVVQQLRGKDRAAGRLAAMSNQGEAGVQAAAKIAESDAGTSLAAQTKLADISSQRNALQAQLDEAKASGDAGRVQEIIKKIADLEQDTQKTNAGISERTADRTVRVGEAGNTGRLAAETAGSAQDIAQNDLRMRAQKALEDSAKGVLTEDSRQEAIAMARREQDAAEQRMRTATDEAARSRASQDRSFWTTTLTTLLGLAIPGPKPAAAAHGGAVQAPRTVIVGEAGNAEIIVPVKGKLSERLAAALSIEAKPFEDPKESGEIDTADQLTAAIKKTLGNFRAKMGKKAVDDEDDEVSEMAAATLRSRRARGAA